MIDAVDACVQLVIDGAMGSYMGGVSRALRQRIETNYLTAAILLPEQAAVRFLTEAKNLRRISMEELRDHFETQRVTGYIGFDATAPSLHVGSLVQIMMLRRLQQAGHKPIVLMGGGTTKVGDPTDKEKSRPLLTDDQINANIAGIKTAFEPFLRFGDGANDAIMVNNNDWLGELGYLEMLRAIGVYFTINTMVKQDTVRRRLEAEAALIAANARLEDTVAQRTAEPGDDDEKKP